MKFRTLLLLLLAVFAVRAEASDKPIVTFVKANIGDSARVVKERAFDLILRDAVNETGCLTYVNLYLRDSVARIHEAAKSPFTFADMRRECGARYGVFFSFERYGYLVRLATRVVDSSGTALERTDLDLLKASDTLSFRNPFEGVLRRMLGLVAKAIAMKADSACPVRVPAQLSIVAGGVVMHKLTKGFNMFLTDNADRICDMIMTRVSDTLRLDRRMLVIDLFSRDRLYGKLGEFGIQNTSTPTATEVALMNATGIQSYLIAEIDSAEGYSKLRVSVYGFSTAPQATTALFNGERIIEPDLEQMYVAISGLATEAAEKLLSLTQ